MSFWWESNLVLIQTTFTTLLLALSVFIPMRLGVFSFSGIGAFGIGAYSTGAMILTYHWDMWFALFFGALFAGVVNFLLGAIVQRLTGLYLAMSTIAFDLIVVVVIENGGSLTGGSTGLFGIIGSITILQVACLTLGIMFLVALSEYGKTGRRIQAIHDDSHLSTSLGISVGRYRRLSFFLGGAIEGLGGGIVALQRTTITPEIVSFHLIVLVLTIIIVGGIGSWVGLLVGTILFVWLPNWLTFIGEYREIIYGLIVVLCAIYLPSGIVGFIKQLQKNFVMSRRNSGVPISGSTNTEEIAKVEK